MHLRDSKPVELTPPQRGLNVDPRLRGGRFSLVGRTNTIPPIGADPVRGMGLASRSVQALTDDRPARRDNARTKSITAGRKRDETSYQHGNFAEHGITPGFGAVQANEYGLKCPYAEPRWAAFEALGSSTGPFAF